MTQADRPPCRDPAHDALRPRLAEGLDALGQRLPEAAMTRLLDHVSELARWNRAYNLTAITDPAEMIDRHVIDSLSVRPVLRGQRIVDAGTGAGLPGLVLAVAEPDRHFMLVDSNGKKIRFLAHVVRRLGLDNAEPVHGRIETLALDAPPDEIVTRAFAPLDRQVGWCARWLDAGARLLAMKGRLDDPELRAVPDAYNVALETLTWPGQQAARSLAIVTRGEPN